MTRRGEAPLELLMDSRIASREGKIFWGTERPAPDDSSLNKSHSGRTLFANGKGKNEKRRKEERKLLSHQFYGETRPSSKPTSP